MNWIISGGCKNGKSLIAQCIARNARADGKPLYYLATMLPTDSEDEQRIARHQRIRAGWGFETVDAARDLFAVVARCDPAGSFLLDSATALLANEMFQPDGTIAQDAADKVAADITACLQITDRFVIVSDYIYSDAFCYDPLTEAYRKGLAHIERRAAQECDAAVEIIGGIALVYKGNKRIFDETRRAVHDARKAHQEAGIVEGVVDGTGDVFGLSCSPK